MMNNKTPSSAGFVELAWMTRQRPAIGENHCPGHARVRVAAPQLAVDEVCQTPQQQADRPHRAGHVSQR